MFVLLFARVFAWLLGRFYATDPADIELRRLLLGEQVWMQKRYALWKLL